MDTKLALQKDVESLLEDYRPFHDDTQIESFIAMKAGDTPWGWYVQCLREINKRNDAAFNMRCAIETLDIDLAELDQLIKGGSGFEKQRKEIERRRKIAEKARAERTLVDCLRELHQFTLIAHRLRKKHNFVNLSDDDRRTLTQRTWVDRVVYRINVEERYCGGLSKATFDLFASLPEESRRQVRALTERDKALSEEKPLALVQT